MCRWFIETQSSSRGRGVPESIQYWRLWGSIFVSLEKNCFRSIPRLFHIFLNTKFALKKSWEKFSGTLFWVSIQWQWQQNILGCGTDYKHFSKFISNNTDSFRELKTIVRIFSQRCNTTIPYFIFSLLNTF